MGLSRTVINQYIEKLQRILTESSFCVCIQNFVNLHIPKDPKSRNATCILQLIFTKSESKPSTPQKNISFHLKKKRIISQRKVKQNLFMQ